MSFTAEPFITGSAFAYSGNRVWTTSNRGVSGIWQRDAAGGDN